MGTGGVANASCRHLSELTPRLAIDVCRLLLCSWPPACGASAARFRVAVPQPVAASRVVVAALPDGHGRKADVLDWAVTYCRRERGFTFAVFAWLGNDVRGARRQRSSARPAHPRLAVRQARPLARARGDGGPGYLHALHLAPKTADGGEQEVHQFTSVKDLMEEATHDCLLYSGSTISTVALADQRRLSAAYLGKLSKALRSGMTYLATLDLSACEGVTAVGDGFAACLPLCVLRFPRNLRSIGDECAACCTRLECFDLTLCTALTAIGTRFAEGCSSLREMRLQCPEPRSLGSGAFRKRRTLDLSECVALTAVGADLAAGCPALGTLAMPAGGSPAVSAELGSSVQRRM